MCFLYYSSLTHLSKSLEFIGVFNRPPVQTQYTERSYSGRDSNKRGLILQPCGSL